MRNRDIRHGESLWAALRTRDSQVVARTRIPWVALDDKDPRSMRVVGGGKPQGGTSLGRTQGMEEPLVSAVIAARVDLFAAPLRIVPQLSDA